MEKLLNFSLEQKKQKKILDVNDSISLRILFEKGLSREGYQVVLAENGKKVLETIYCSPQI